MNGRVSIENGEWIVENGDYGALLFPSPDNLPPPISLERATSLSKNYPLSILNYPLKRPLAQVSAPYDRIKKENAHSHPRNHPYAVRKTRHKRKGSLD
jgi:hypothetical protein